MFVFEISQTFCRAMNQVGKQCNDGREKTMARHVSQIDHQPDKKKNGILGYCVLPMQKGNGQG